MVNTLVFLTSIQGFESLIRHQIKKVIVMKRVRKLYFTKHINMINEHSYISLNNLSVIVFLLERFDYSQIKYKFKDFGESYIKIKCTKKEFRKFIYEFIIKFHKNLDNIRV